MGQKLNALDLALYRAVDEVLHHVWDPIGISGMPQARDEYHAYLPQIFALLREGGHAGEIANYLSQVAVGHMGLSENAKHDLEVAHVLLEWKELIREQQA